MQHGEDVIAERGAHEENNIYNYANVLEISMKIGNYLECYKLPKILRGYQNLP